MKSQVVIAEKMICLKLFAITAFNRIRATPTEMNASGDAKVPPQGDRS
jgi:hypothetical protein